MGYYLYAWLENGIPQLQIIEAKSKSICLSWSYQGIKDTNNKEIQRLFKDLILLTCKQQMSNYRVFNAKPPVQQKLICS